MSKKAKLSEVLKKKYLADTSSCPVCGKPVVVINRMMFARETHLLVRCTGCAREFTEIWKLAGVELAGRQDDRMSFRVSFTAGVDSSFRDGGTDAETKSKLADEITSWLDDLDIGIDNMQID